MPCGKRVRIVGIRNPAVWLGSKVPGKIGGLVNKAFGNSKSDRKVYDSVVIKSDVGSIGKYAFCNSSINNIEFHGLGLQSGNIDPTAFVSSSDEDSDWHINIGNLSC